MTAVLLCSTEVVVGFFEAVPLLEPDPDFNPTTVDVTSPLYKYPPNPSAVVAIVIVLLPSTNTSSLVPRLTGLPLTVAAGPPGVRVTVPARMMKGGLEIRRGMVSRPVIVAAAVVGEGVFAIGLE